MTSLRLGNKFTVTDIEDIKYIFKLCGNENLIVIVSSQAVKDRIKSIYSISPNYVPEKWYTDDEVIKVQQ